VNRADRSSLTLTPLSQTPCGFVGEAAPAFYCGRFLLSGSTMSYEIMLARLLSVVIW
jgi:hypothetical protein